MSTVAEMRLQDPLDELDLNDPELFADGPPHALFARMRSEAPVLWNAMGHDWKLPNSPEQVEARLSRGIEASRRRGRGSNLLLHDGGQASIGQDRSHSVTATDRILRRYRAEGVRFVTVDAWNAQP